MSNVVSISHKSKPRRYSTAITRLLYNIQVDPITGCWIWQCAKSRIGYGTLRVDGQNTSPHRISYRYFIGEIPDGKEVHHVCYVRACCNPLHLEAVTHKENLIDAFLGVQKSEVCRNGHAYTEENTRIGKHGNRTCRACVRAALKRFRRRNPDAARTIQRRWYHKRKDAE